MKPALRANRTSSFNSKLPRLIGAAGVVALGALLASWTVIGCSDSGGDPGTDKGGQANVAGSENNSVGGEANGDAGAMTGVSGTKNSAGASNNGGKASSNGGMASTDGGEATATGGAGEQPDPGGAGLGTADGITGTFEGKVHAHLFNAAHVPQQTETSVIGANSAMYPLWDLWQIRYLPQLGEQTCSGGTGTADTFITFGSQTNFSQAGTTADATCSLNITSLVPKIEGTFTATLKTDHGDVAVTDGAFRVPN